MACPSSWPRNQRSRPTARPPALWTAALDSAVETTIGLHRLRARHLHDNVEAVEVNPAVLLEGPLHPQSAIALRLEKSGSDPPGGASQNLTAEDPLAAVCVPQ